MKNFLKLLLASTILLTASCSHKQVMVHKGTDPDMTCADIRVEMTQMESVLDDINEKTGVSGRNVGMALFFWPGILVNQMNAGDARKLATERMQVLASLRKEKGCNQEVVNKAKPVQAKTEVTNKSEVKKPVEVVAEQISAKDNVNTEVK